LCRQLDAAPAVGCYRFGARPFTRTTHWQSWGDRPFEVLLAVTSAQRLKQLPGSFWVTAAAIQRFVAMPETRERFDKDGIEPVGNAPDVFAVEIAHEMA